MKTSAMAMAMVIAAAASTGCAGAAPAEDAAATGEELQARAPIGYVLQYVGHYDGAAGAHVEYVLLKRNGTFVAQIDGVTERGRFVGPTQPKEPLKASFIARGDGFSATLRADWQASRYKLDISRHGATETLTASFPAGGEEVCDSSGGAWSDDDPDRQTGLYCTCPSPKVFIPSAGGCTR